MIYIREVMEASNQQFALFKITESKSRLTKQKAVQANMPVFRTDDLVAVLLTDDGKRHAYGALVGKIANIILDPNAINEATARLCAYVVCDKRAVIAPIEGIRLFNLSSATALPK